MQKSKWKKILAIMLCMASVLGQTVPVAAQEITSVVVEEQTTPEAEVNAFEDSEVVVQEETQNETENIARGKNAVASSKEADSVRASNAVDGDNTSHNSRWGSDRGDAPHWIYVDLGQEMDVKTVGIYWENRKATAYKIQVASELSQTMADSDWTTVKTFTQRPADVVDVIKLDSVQRARYVRLYVDSFTAQDPDDPNKSWDTVSIYEMEIYGGDVNLLTQDPAVNVANGSRAVSSSDETDTLTADKAVDGNIASTRWSSDRGLGPHWIYVDLGRVREVKGIRIFWETRKATAYKIQLAETLSATMQDSDWTDAKVINHRPEKLKDIINLDEAQQARYVRLYIDNITESDPDGALAWDTISIYEMEVYGGDVPLDLMDQIRVVQPEPEDAKLELVLPTVEGKTIAYNGTDYEQLVDDELNIYQPLVDSVATVSVKITDNNTGNYEFKEMQVTIPGKYAVEEGDNAAPNVLPELREWKGYNGTYEITENTRVVYKEDMFQHAAESLADDYEKLTGKTLEVVQAEEADADDLFFKQTSGKGLLKEGYIMEIAGNIVVEAEEATGAYWATRTILQSIKVDGNIPQGITRDYPLYEVRGFILDVARKTFTMDYLKQVVQEMAWYKLNDFQIHLNDNYIWLREYNGEEAMNAYSGFRLESDIKKGGNNGLNMADLTSTDVFYTKNEFRQLIKDARACGVNIVPEIDVPAHSLAFTKVRPDLKIGTNGTENDHFDLVNHFDESVEFVQSVFDEYMGADLTDPVFDMDTVIHLGCDEYEASAAQYRHFCNSMIDYVQGNGRTVRFWGGLTRLVADVEVRSEDVQINLWSKDWARMDQMYELGYDMINCLDSQYYIVPNAGYYFDYLDDNVVYNAAINTNNGVTIPAGDEQMLGGAFALWNDMTDRRDNGVSEYDVYDRIKKPIALFGAKLWGKQDLNLNGAVALSQELGSAPGTNFAYEAEEENGVIAHYPMDNMAGLKEANNAYVTKTDGKNALKLNGEESYVKTDFTTVGLGNDLRVKVKRTSLSNEEQILFESPYGSIKAVQADTGKVGFSRENFDYSFNYTLPLNEWVELEFKNTQNRVQLFVNGVLTDTLGDDETVEGRPVLATMMIPVEKIGSETNAFQGYVDDIRVGTVAEFNSTMELDYALMEAEEVLKNTENETLKALVEEGKEVLNLYAPEADKIADLVAAIKEETSDVTFEKADYTEVDYYLEKATGNLSDYTPESVATLQQVVDSVIRDLPAYKQAVVDGYAVALAKALNELVIVDHFRVDPALIATMSASSYNSQDEAPEKAIDGDISTIWHTEYSKTGENDRPHWIQIELKEAQSLGSLIYNPRSAGGENGIFTGYEVKVSTNGTDFTTVSTGTWANNSNEKKAVFEQVVTAKYIRLVGTSSVNNFGSAAEIRLERAFETADVEGLTALINQAKAFTQENYTKASWDALQEKIAEAETLSDQQGVSATGVEIMKRELKLAMNSLWLATTPVEDNKEEGVVYTVSFNDADGTTLFTQKVEKDGKVEIPVNPVKKGYSFQGWFVGEAEYDFATSVTEDCVLVAKWVVDRSVLEQLVAENEDLEIGIYTEASWKAFTNALNEAISVLAKEEVTVEEIVRAQDALRTAIAELEELELVYGDILEEDREGMREVPTSIWVAGVPESVSYNGTKQVFNLRVYDGNKLLREKKDYTVSYKNNQNVSNYSEKQLADWIAAGKDISTQDKKLFAKVPQVILKMKGDYTGTKTLYFHINQKSISDNDLSADDIYVNYNKGKVQKPAVTLLFNGKKLGKKDFYVEEYNAAKDTEVYKALCGTEGETTTVTLHLKGDGNFTGERTVTLAIGQKNKDVAMSKVKVTLPKSVTWSDFVKEGYKLAEEQLKVSLDKNTMLTAEKDYLVEYENHQALGKATVILTGIAKKGEGISCYGKKRVTFQIKGDSISSAVVGGINADGYAYTGKEIEVLDDVTVTLGTGENARTLEAGKDFEVSYSKNINQGKATMILTGKASAGLSGTKKVTYKINKVDISNLPTNEITEVAYVKGGAKPAITVKHGDFTLTEGKDYTVSYKDNKNVTADGDKATATIKGKGNFVGQKVVEYTVTSKEIDGGEVSIVVKDKVVSTKSGGWKQSFKVVDKDGKALGKNDYDTSDVVYKYKAVGETEYKDLGLSDKVPARNLIQITIKGKGAYTGELSAEYLIMEKNKDISKATVEIDDQYYTGAPITLDDTKITVKFKNEENALRYVEDESQDGYRIVEGSYVKNTNKGTAKVTIEGAGTYGGTKVVSFKIKQRDVADNWWEDLKASFQSLFGF